MSVPREPALRQKMKHTGSGRSVILVALVPLIMSACMALSGRCIYETRAVTVNGKLARGPGDTVSVLLNLGEQRDTDPNKSMNWGIHGPSLKIHVLSVTLRDNTEPATVLFTFPLTTNGRPAISEGAADQNQGTNLNGLFDRLADGRGFVRIETDLPGEATIDIPLTVSSKQDWSRPYCS